MQLFCDRQDFKNMYISTDRYSKWRLGNQWLYRRRFYVYLLRRCDFTFLLSLSLCLSPTCRITDQVFIINFNLSQPALTFLFLRFFLFLILSFEKNNDKNRILIFTTQYNHWRLALQNFIYYSRNRQTCYKLCATLQHFGATIRDFIRLDNHVLNKKWQKRQCL